MIKRYLCKWFSTIGTDSREFIVLCMIYDCWVASLSENPRLNNAGFLTYIFNYFSN